VPESCDLRFVGPAFAHAGGAEVPTRHLLHFDTETTGLAGGTGTRAFMIGAADWHDGALRVRQLLITTLSAEPAMLDCFAGWLDRDTTLVSYNGRCYDAPLLATRYRLARMRNPLEGLAHADLLFAVRRRFRGVWEKLPPGDGRATLARRAAGGRPAGLRKRRAPGWITCAAATRATCAACSHTTTRTCARSARCACGSLRCTPARPPVALRTGQARR
jgi:hypothetical protein